MLDWARCPEGSADCVCIRRHIIDTCYIHPYMYRAHIHRYHVYMYIYTHTYMYACMYVCMHACMNVCMFVCLSAVRSPPCLHTESFFLLSGSVIPLFVRHNFKNSQSPKPSGAR